MATSPSRPFTPLDDPQTERLTSPDRDPSAVEELCSLLVRGLQAAVKKRVPRRAEALAEDFAQEALVTILASVVRIGPVVYPIAMDQCSIGRRDSVPFGALHRGRKPRTYAIARRLLGLPFALLLYTFITSRIPRPIAHRNESF